MLVDAGSAVLRYRDLYQCNCIALGRLDSNSRSCHGAAGIGPASTPATLRLLRYLCDAVDGAAWSRQIRGCISIPLAVAHFHRCFGPRKPGALTARVSWAVIVDRLCVLFVRPDFLNLCRWRGPPRISPEWGMMLPRSLSGVMVLRVGRARVEVVALRTNSVSWVG